MACEHPLECIKKYHDDSIVCDKCLGVIEQHGKEIDPPCYLDGGFKARKLKRASSASLTESIIETWIKETPTEAGYYWYWEEDYGEPECMEVMKSISDGRCFTSMMRNGLDSPKYCNEYSGWWMRVFPPNPPIV